MPKCVLIVDDDPAQRRILEEIVKRFGYTALSAESGEQALAALKQASAGDISLILLDLVMPGLDGLGVLDRLRGEPSAPPVIVQTANGSIESAINAMRAGATDFVVKPVNPERLQVSINNALRITQLESEIKRIKRSSNGSLTFSDIITRSPAMARVIDLGHRAGQSNIPVLIEGESGVGKELIARAIQGESGRSGRPFVTVNCGAIPETLVESTLFGHEKGAFTGAVARRDGKFLEADGGTLFLDEIGELPLEAQVKLLRALQEGEIDPVGARASVKVDIRLISATNVDMIRQVRESRFREDLYYRLNVFPIWVPPLRERLEDVPDLAQHFLSRFAAEEGKRVSGVSGEAIDMLCRYPWPGNVRQLENAVFRAVVLADGDTIGVAEFPQIAAHVEGFEAVVPPAPRPRPKEPQFEGPAMIGGEAMVPPTVKLNGDTGREGLGIPALTAEGDVRPLEAIEADMIRLAFGRYRGHMTEIARKLGIGRSTLYRKMREIGLEARAG
ncbi:MAG: sigma-54-dependent transcriptional regulator [Hyphomicrobiales bacterium]